jgi:Ala-tRNA(Pro) deacylase
MNRANSERLLTVRGTNLEEGAKALIVNVDSQKMMFVVSAVSKLDLGSLKKTFSAKDLSLISLEELEKLTGLKPGAIPPFGSLFGIKTYLDEKLANMEMLSFNAGANDKSIRMKVKDFILAEKPENSNFAK